MTPCPCARVWVKSQGYTMTPCPCVRVWVKSQGYTVTPSPCVRVWVKSQGYTMLCPCIRLWVKSQLHNTLRPSPGFGLNRRATQWPCPIPDFALRHRVTQWHWDGYRPSLHGHNGTGTHRGKGNGTYRDSEGNISYIMFFQGNEKMCSKQKRWGLDRRTDARQSKQQGGYVMQWSWSKDRQEAVKAAGWLYVSWRSSSLHCRPASISRPSLHTSVSESTICCPGHNLHSMCICHGNVNP